MALCWNYERDRPTKAVHIVGLKIVAHAMWHRSRSCHKSHYCQINSLHLVTTSRRLHACNDATDWIFANLFQISEIMRLNIISRLYVIVVRKNAF